MFTQHKILMLVLCTVILFSCNNKKQTQSSLNHNNTTAINTDTVNVAADEAIDIASYNTLFEQNSREIFTVKTNKISVITGKKGLKVTINPGVLEKADGSPVDGDIKVEMIELVNTDDLFKSNAATVSNGRLLASGGSYFVGMECNGQKLHIKKGGSLQMQFPKFKKEEMELFYGQRSVEGNMNWVRAGIELTAEPEYELDFTYNLFEAERGALPGFAYDTAGQLRIFRTLNEEVYYYANRISIKNLVDTINRYSTKIYIDTVYTWPRQPAVLPKGARIDSNYLYHVYGPPKQFCIKNCRAIEEEQRRKEKEMLARQEAIKNWQPQTMAGQLQKYYNPSAITYLGWINCDRFYQYKEQSEVQLDIPYTFRKGNINYFVILQSMNGLLNGKIKIDSAEKLSIGNLPVGVQATLVAFTKNNSQLYHCKENFVVQKNRSVKLDFKNISAEEMTKMFGKNVKI